MKKISILFLAFTTWATAQQKTGINTTKPQATFDVTAKTDNTTNEVEGLLIPRVSKQKALNMTANPITESTMIYVNDLTDFNNPADGTEAKVAEITENGFYHWNGTQWVKAVSKDGGEWVYEPKNKRVVLKRRPGDLGFASYNDKGEFIYKSNTKGKIRVFNYLTQSYDEYPVSEYTGYAHNERMGFASDLEIKQPSTIYRIFNGNYLVADNSDTKATNNPNLKSNVNVLTFTSDNAYSYNFAHANENAIIVDGSNKISKSVGSLNQTYIDRNGKVVAAVGAKNIASTRSIYDNDYLAGSENIVGTYTTNKGNINKKATASYNLGTFNTSANVKESNSVLSTFALGSTFSGAIDTHYFLKNTTRISTLSTGVVNNVYGLYMDDMNFGTNSNYAIYTNAGLNSFGDDVRIRNINSQISTDPNYKVVVADADGTLRVSEKLTNNNSWTLNGNAGTDPDNNFIGTTDNKPLNFRTYESNKMTITPDGRVGIGTTTPNALYEIEVEADGTYMSNRNDIYFSYYMNNTTYLEDPITFHFNVYGGTKNNPQNIKTNTFLSNTRYIGYVNGDLKKLTNIGSYYRGDGTSIMSDYYIGVSGKTNDFHIKENHNIGIGTTDPQEKLDVVGNVKAEKGIFTNLPEYPNHTDAMNDTALVTGALYIVRTADDAKQVFVK